MRKLIYTILLLTSVSIVSAQSSFVCDFEDATERSLWHLNSHRSGAEYADDKFDQLWYIGAPGNCGLTGENGLFISCDQGQTVSYKGNQTTYVTAYRDVTLTPGAYTIRFDWLMQGKTADRIVVAWVPTTDACNSAPSTGALPTKINSYIINPTGPTLNKKSCWTSYSATLNVTQATGRLVFYFYCTQGGATQPAAAVDNIEIMNQSCTAPTNLTYTPATGTLSWGGSGWYYDIRYYSYQAGVWYEIKNHMGKSINLNLQDEGFTYFYVRQVCDSANNVHSAWVTTSQFVYMPGRRCVEYMDIGAGGTHAGVCYTGRHSSSTSHTSLAFGSTPQMVDKGYASDQSMHTVHYDANETDVNTNNELRTVPDGEIASVRIGAYTSSGDDARIEYKYRVKQGQSDLMDLSYACVLESGGHSNDNPFFQLDILDQRGQQIPGCTHEYFVADMTGSGGGKWHQNGDVWWSSWDKVTVSLRDYVGQTLTIRLTASRCIYDTHYGYAYFTIGCRSGDLQGLSCGDFSTDHFTAPDGFNYRWKSTEDNSGRVLSTDQKFNIDPQDTTIYIVDVISKSNGNCYYTLTANPNPRFPVASLEATTRAVDCKNVVDFKEDSYISVINRVNHNVMERSQDPLDEVLVDYGDGSPIQSLDDHKFTHQFPAEGGNYQILLTASMSGGVCTSVDTLNITLPDLSPSKSFESRQWCNSQGPMTYKKKQYTSDFSDTTVYKSALTGCDSLHILEVHFVDKTTSEVLDTICSNDPAYKFFGKEIMESGIYTHTLENAAGCDSVITLKLHVNPKLFVTTESDYTICADDRGWELPFEVTSGNLSGVKLALSNIADTVSGLDSVYYFAPGEPLMLQFDSALRAGIYYMDATFQSPWCGDQTVKLALTVLFERSILEQFVGQGFFSVHNERYNGNYMITGFQWLRNGEPIPGATQSYIYVPKDERGTEYTCMLTRSDGVSLPACPLWYDIETAISDVETSGLSLNEAMSLVTSGQATMEVYDSMGRLLGAEMPQMHGIYLVKIHILNSGLNTAFKCIR